MSYEMFKTYLLLLNLFFFHQGRTNALVIPRIVNGFRAWLGEFPYQASLQKLGELYCGGIILDEYHILTAAHCVEGHPPEFFNVIVGNIDLRTFHYPASNHTVTDIKIHEKCNLTDSFENDIALLTLRNPIRFGIYIKPAILPSPHQDYEHGYPAWSSGYGRTSNLDDLSPVLYKTLVFIEDRDECQKSYLYNKVRSTNVCTRHPIRRTGFCRGDSGGPLTINGQVVGIISFALDNACATESKKPQVYVRLSEYIDWIYGHMTY